MTGAMNSNTKTIYVELLNEGTFVLRPTQGEEVSQGNYRLIATSDYDPVLENWKFKPGTIVKCEWEEHEGERVLVAKFQSS